LLATSLGRLYSSAFYALYDTRTPLRFAIIRVVLTTILGFLFALWLPRAFGIDARWGIGGLAASAGIAGWVEFSLLRHSLSERIGEVSLSPRFLITLWTASLAGAALAYGVKMIVGTGHPLVVAIIALGLYGLVYLGATYAFQIAEAQSTIRTALKRLGIR
jgi:putative peptidoglycan lipid II flippase